MTAENKDKATSAKHWIDELKLHYPKGRVETMSGHEIENLIIRSQNEFLFQRVPGKYKKITAIVKSLSKLKIIPSIETSYHVFRALDDIIDEDVPLPENSSDHDVWLTQIKDSVLFGSNQIPKRISIEYLMERMFLKLRNQDIDSEARQEVVNFINAAALERKVRQTERVFSKEELSVMYHNTTAPASNIALIGVGSKNRIEDVPEFAQIPPRAFSLVALEHDLGQGIFNIPSEILNHCGLSLEELVANPNVTNQNSAIQGWIKTEVDDLDSSIDNLNSRRLDLRAKLFINTYIYAIEKIDIDPIRKKISKFSNP